MKKSRSSISRVCLLLLAVVFALSFTTMASATNEIINIDSNGVRTDGAPIKWTQDVTIQWEANMSTGHVLQGFVYRWNTSATPLTDLTEANAEGTVSNSINPPYVTKPASFFANDDSNVLRYLHVRTWYNSGSGVAYSDDVVIGPINIDNVAPTGTVRITDSEGSDITSTYSANLNLRLSASREPVKVYVNETANRDTATSYTYASNVPYTLNNADPGSKTIYVWFEDGAGNVSSAAVSYTVTLLSSVTINPYDGTFDISLEELDFIVDGTTATYNWTITTLSGDDVADFIGTASATNGVTVSFHNPGTFKLTATPTVGGSAISSGTITVEERGVTITHTYVSGLNLVAFTLSGTGITKASELDQAIVAANSGVTVSQVFGWDAANQRFTNAYINLGSGMTSDDFDLVQGAAYFVQVDGDATLELTGQGYNSFSLITGLNLLGLKPEKSGSVLDAEDFDADIVVATGLTVSQVFGWDPTNQRFTNAYINLGLSLIHI